MAGSEFPRSRRLTHPDEFKHVFERGRHRRFNSENFVIRARERDNGHEARIGLAISKRSLKRSVDRNRIKRLVRESFRKHCARLPDLDIVVLSQPGLRQISNITISEQLDDLWEKIAACYTPTQSKPDAPSPT